MNGQLVPIPFIKINQARKLAVFFDTCENGSATASFTEIALERGFDERKIIANLSKEGGIAIFFAASPTQAAFEVKSLGYGIFTWSVLEVINNRTKEGATGELISLAKLLALVNRLTNQRHSI